MHPQFRVFFGYELDAALFSQSGLWRNQIGIHSMVPEEIFRTLMRWIMGLHAEIQLPPNIGTSFHFKNMINLFQKPEVINGFYSALSTMLHPFKSICHIPIGKGELPTENYFGSTLQAQLMQCKALKSHGVIVHPPETRENTGEIFIQELTSPKIINALIESESIVYIENAQTSSTYFQELGHLVELRERLIHRYDELRSGIDHERIKFCFDTGHYLLYQQRDGNGTMDWETNAAPFFAHADVFHIHSNDGSKDQHLLPYTNGQPAEKHFPFNFKIFLENCHRVVHWLQEADQWAAPGNKFYILEVYPQFQRKELMAFWFQICAKLHLGC